jgi:signal transduction histidine kinase
MSLRARLAILYTSIVGGILLLFGVAVYSAVSVSLTNLIESRLLNTIDRIYPSVIVNADGSVNVIPVFTLGLSTDVYVQVWERGNHLVYKSPNLINYSLPLDPDNIQSGKLVFQDVSIPSSEGPVHLRVATVPLYPQGLSRRIATLQVATSLAIIESTQRSLLYFLILGVILSMTIAGLAGWITTRQALAPLGDVTRTALQITNADDLSRRIPYSGPPDDEVGQLIHAFNQTLSRLENLFNTQRRFLADVGHELRTPLTVIKGNVDLMRRMRSMDEETLDSIESEVDRLTRLVGDLLLLAQAESGKLPLDRRLVELDTLLLEAMQQMRVLARDRIQMRLGEIDQVLVCGDSDRLKQVLVNLIGNAIKYTPPGGEVVMSLGKVDSRARLTITDNGPGITQEDLPHIFERFYRGEKSRTRQKEGKGFGLGLSIAYWIVRNHGGQIEVESRTGQGTTFCVWLPLSQGDCKEE